MVPIPPNNNTPNGAEFHLKLLTCHPRYDKYLHPASSFLGPRGFFFRKLKNVDNTLAMMKMPILHMKNAIVGNAKTQSAMYLKGR